MITQKKDKNTLFNANKFNCCNKIIMKNVYKR